ncbi:MAG: hypothetical protein WC975_03485 [Phycisphaerae bacterium]
MIRSVNSIAFISLILPAVCQPVKIFASDNDWSGAEKVFVVMPINSTSGDQGRSLADSIQIRLRSEIQEKKLNGYVLSWAEMEIYLQDQDAFFEKLGLSKQQELIILHGKLTQLRQNKMTAEIALSRVTFGQDVRHLEQNFESNDERTKPILSIRVTDYILQEIFHQVEKPPPASTRPARWGKGYTPKGWDPVDNLCSFWIKSDYGKCIMFDTDVRQDQAWDWWKAIKAGVKPADAPKPIRTDPPHYDAVGGIEGVKLYSDYMEAIPGKTYLLSVRVKGPIKGNAMIFVKAYALLPTSKSETLQRREVWQTYLHCVIGDENWKKYELIFTLPKTLPPVEKKMGKEKTKIRQPKLQWIRLMPYANWEVGKYYFDDVALCPANP